MVNKITQVHYLINQRFLNCKTFQKNAVSSAVDDEDEEDKCYDTESFSGLYNNINSDNPEGVASNMHQVGMDNR